MGVWQCILATPTIPQKGRDDSASSQKKRRRKGKKIRKKVEGTCLELLDISGSTRFQANGDLSNRSPSYEFHM